MPIISFFETFELLRPVHIGSYLRETLAYSVMSCLYSDYIVVRNIPAAATCSDWTIPESNTGLKRNKAPSFRLYCCLNHSTCCDLSDCKFPESNTGLQRNKALSLRLYRCLNPSSCCDLFRLEVT